MPLNWGYIDKNAGFEGQFVASLRGPDKRKDEVRSRISPSATLKSWAFEKSTSYWPPTDMAQITELGAERTSEKMMKHYEDEYEHVVAWQPIGTVTGVPHEILARLSCISRDCSEIFKQVRNGIFSFRYLQGP